MTKYISLFGATTTDTQVQVVKENQVIIGIGAGAVSYTHLDVYKRQEQCADTSTGM